MENINQKILQNFGINGFFAGKRKGGFLIKSGKKVLFLKKTSANSNEIIFQNNIKKHLALNNFKNIDMYYETLEGAPFLKVNSENYILTDYVDAPEIDFCNSDMFLKLVKKSAQMHMLIGDAKIESEISENSLTEFKKSLSLFKEHKKLISKRSTLSDFDIIFIENYDYYLSLAKDSIDCLEENNYYKLITEKKETTHNLLKKENLVALNNDIYITNFSKARTELSVKDLADLIKRFVKYNKEPEVDINEILNTYSEIKPLSLEEKNIFYAMLKFPTEFFKISREYYSKKRSWTPGSIITKTDEIIERKERYEKYINKISI
ncbi:MAG: hypothetical protein FWD82_06080 [Defluviitaleaceae bacterium]|nr:hypothetical protein [Defluviitaleaceae bacterium]